MKKFMLTLGMAGAALLTPVATTMAADQIPDPCDVYCAAYTEYGMPAPMLACKWIDEAKMYLKTFAKRNPYHRDKVEDAIQYLKNAQMELKNKYPPDYIAAVGSLEGAMGDLEAIYWMLRRSGRETFRDNALAPIWKAARILAAEQLCGAIQYWETAYPWMSWEDSDELVAASMYWVEAHRYWKYGKFKDSVAKLKAVLDKTEDVCEGLCMPPECETPEPPMP